MDRVRSIALTLLSIVLLTVCAAAGIKGYLWYQDQFVRLGDHHYRKDSVLLDLRDQMLSAQEYEQLHRLLPECVIEWTVPIQNQRVAQDITQLTLTAPTQADLEALRFLPKLETVQISDCREPGQLLALREQYPDLELQYQLSVNGKQIDNDVTELTVESLTAEELRNLIPHLTNLTTLRLEGTIPSAAELRELVERFPSVKLQWTAALGGMRWDGDSREVELAGQSLSAEELQELLSFLPKAETVDITGCGLTEEAYRQTADAFPGVVFRGGAITLLGMEIPSDIEELNLSDVKMSDTAELEAAIPYLRNLKKVDMCRCGLSNEEMDALNRRYEEIRFVWEVVICTRRFRTDATGFIVTGVDRHIVNSAKDEEVGQLRYCTDMISVDLGHFCSVTSCDWAAYMPNLQYLLIGETHISDLTPLTGLKNLVWLEMFDVSVTDLSALTQITSLEDLNLGGILCDPTPIAEMTWLKNLWWFGVEGRTDVPARFAPDILPSALPNTNIKFDMLNACAGGWRKLPNYYKMRDALGMGYMD